MRSPYPVFDIHTHTYPEAIAARAVESLGKFYEFEVAGLGTYEDLEAAEAPLGVKGFLLFSVATNAHQVPKVNSSIAALAQHSRERGFLTVGFAGMHQDYPDMEAELDRARALGLRGVKIHPDIQGVDIDDPRLLRLYALMEERAMPLYLHMGDDRPQYRFSEAAKLVRVLEKFPALEVVAAHFGGYRAWEDAALLAGRDRLWFDTSSALWAMTPEEAARLIRLFGTDRVMFGTDYPVQYADAELDRFFAIPSLTEAERKAILFDNAARFLHL